MFSPKPQKMPKRNIAPAAPVMNGIQGGGGDEPPSLFVPATDATCSYPARNTPIRNTVTFKKQRRNRRRSRRN